MPVVAELMHTLMLIEARENRWIERANPSRILSEKPELVRRLTNYERQMREFLGICFRLEPASTLDMLEAMSIQREFGLLTNDSLGLSYLKASSYNGEVTYFTQAEPRNGAKLVVRTLLTVEGEAKHTLKEIKIIQIDKDGQGTYCLKTGI